MKIFDRQSYQPERHTGGFTLLEMVAVLFVVGMTSSMVIPRLPVMQASLDFALKRESFEQAMNGLAYKAFKDNQDFVLDGSYDDHGPIEKDKPSTAPEDGSIPGNMRVLPLIDTTRIVRPPVVPARAELPLPEGWRMEVAKPIQFRASGYCTGGTAEVQVGRRVYTYRFTPPLCEITLER